MQANDRLRRIARMEDIYDRSSAAVQAVLLALERYQALTGELAELEDYYLHGLWLTDFDADRQGDIPQDMKRGILTEDAIWDLLTDVDRMRRMMKEAIRP